MWSFSGLYFPVFIPNMAKYGPEKTPYLDIFHAVNVLILLWVPFTAILISNLGKNV